VVDLRGVKWWIPALGLLLCATVVTAGFGETVESAAERHAETALKDADMADVSVDVDYRWVTLSGPDAYTEEAMTLVWKDVLVTSVVYLPSIEAPPPSPAVSPSMTPEPSVSSPTDAVEAVIPEAQTLTFVVGSAELTAESVVALDVLAVAFLDALAVEPSLRLAIAAHTDSEGADAYNQSLSEARAAAVADYLVGIGVPSGSLVSSGYGESRPVAPNDTEAGRAANRRVEITILED
jgi:OOP family OmpA-OmpF porin